MLGVGPGLLPPDALQLGVPPSVTRDRMVEAVEVILRLFAGERVTYRSDWFNLVDATCRLKPFTWPHPEIAVASSITPSGGKLARKHGFGLLCVAATHASGYDALGVNWKIANETATACGKVMDPKRLRLVGPVHIAPTREEAWAKVQHGGRKYAEYFSRISRPGQSVDTEADEGAALVGDPGDAIAQIQRLREKQGDFGVFLQLAHNWAAVDAAASTIAKHQAS